MKNYLCALCNEQITGGKVAVEVLKGKRLYYHTKTIPGGVKLPFGKECFLGYHYNQMNEIGTRNLGKPLKRQIPIPELLHIGINFDNLVKEEAVNFIKSKYSFC